MVEVAWPDGRVMVRFDSTPAAAREQALAAAAFDPDARALSDSDRRMLVPRLANRPWTGEGPVLAVGVPLAAVADLLRLAAAHCDDLVLRAGVGVGEARLRPDLPGIEAFRDAVLALGGHVAPRRLPPELAEVAWPAPDAVSRSLTLAIKQQLDPNGTLAPGRLAEAA
jgi:FAD/FMN-containing dehydrogenase